MFIYLYILDVKKSKLYFQIFQILKNLNYIINNIYVYCGLKYKNKYIWEIYLKIKQIYFILHRL